MGLSKLAIHSFRNIAKLEYTSLADFNLILGPNGSGKTSVLEAIHFLSLARSFRTRNHHKVISFEKTHLTVFAELNNKTTLGVEKHRAGATKLRIDNQEVLSNAHLAAILPVCVLNADSYQLLNGTAQNRRQFLDWGVFHFDVTFLSAWKETQRILKQRNAGLQQKLPPAQIKIWDELLVQQAELLHQQRLNYLTQFLPLFQSLMQTLYPLDIHCQYLRGWTEEISYELVLNQHWHRDQTLGYTQYGPHRADLQWRVGDRLAKDVLSRGQQKLLIIAMCLAQGLLLHQHKSQRCVYLIDDLSAELDEKNCAKVTALLTTIQAQIFITGVDEKGLQPLQDISSLARFHTTSL